ncbi:hypothetical protein [Falsiroseomonas sp.]|uniref:hypothetical protein n=1 Tax=Falsiroseomonas sp. TaxID=2870721 RepID=UPI003F72D4C1
MRPALLALIVLALAGCAELRAPPPAARIPAMLGAGGADPLRDVVGQAALAYADGGRSLANDPAAMARAAAQVELMTVEFGRDLRWAALPASVLFELRGARLEGRAALGIRAGADPDEVVRALAAAHAALVRGDRPAAEAALRPALFEPGGAGTLDFLTRPGPLPQGRIATSLARDEADRLVRSRVWGLTGALDPQAGWVNPEPGRGMGIGPR